MGFDNFGTVSFTTEAKVSEVGTTATMPTISARPRIGSMPNMNGMELLSVLMEKESEIPVLVVTSDVQESTHDEALERGAADILNKPLNEDKLRMMIEGYLGPQEGLA